MFNIIFNEKPVSLKVESPIEEAMTFDSSSKLYSFFKKFVISNSNYKLTISLENESIYFGIYKGELRSKIKALKYILLDCVDIEHSKIESHNLRGLNCIESFLTGIYKTDNLISVDIIFDREDNDKYNSRKGKIGVLKFSVYFKNKNKWETCEMSDIHYSINMEKISS